MKLIDVTKAFATDEQDRPSVGVPKSPKTSSRYVLSQQCSKITFPRVIKHQILEHGRKPTPGSAASFRM